MPKKKAAKKEPAPVEVARKTVDGVVQVASKLTGLVAGMFSIPKPIEKPAKKKKAAPKRTKKKEKEASFEPPKPMRKSVAVAAEEKRKARERSE